MKNDMMSRVSPGATTFIRMDHTHALAAFHRYRIDARPEKKQAVADTLCLALEIHARLEEEIFYPAMRSFAPDLVDKSIPEHNEMRRLIAQLRQTRPQDQAFDTTLLELMRDVMRHVADEETMLLPDAERVLGERRLAELGAEMMRRRFELASPHAGEIAIGTVRTFPGATLAVSGLVVLGAFLVRRAFTRPPTRPALTAPKALREAMPTRALRDAIRSHALRDRIRPHALHDVMRPKQLRATSRSLADRLRHAWAA
jgi:hemerythrin superfamily protein